MTMMALLVNVLQLSSNLAALGMFSNFKDFFLPYLNTIYCVFSTVCFYVGNFSKCNEKIKEMCKKSSNSNNTGNNRNEPKIDGLGT